MSTAPLTPLTVAGGDTSSERLRETESDGQSVWVHDEGLCVARFGVMAYEVHSAGDRPVPLLHGRHQGIEDWIAFREAVKAHHGYDMPARVAPRRYWNTLGIVPVQPVSVPLEAVRRHSDPLTRPVWGRDAVDRATVARMIAEGRLVADFLDEDLRGVTGGPFWDARRIAHFVVHYEPTPMEITVTNNRGDVEIVDGLHRLAAAIYREDPRFNVLLDGDDVGIALAFPDQAAPLIEP